MLLNLINIVLDLANSDGTGPRGKEWVGMKAWLLTATVSLHIWGKINSLLSVTVGFVGSSYWTNPHRRVYRPI